MIQNNNASFMKFYGLTTFTKFNLPQHPFAEPWLAARKVNRIHCSKESPDWDRDMNVRLTIEWHESGNIGDFSSLAPEKLVKDHVKRTFEQSAVKGPTYVEVKMIDPKDAHDPIVIELDSITEPIWELQPRIGVKSDPHSGVKQLSECDACGYKKYSAWEEGKLQIDLHDWEEKGRPDIFHLEEWNGFMIVTEKVKTIIERNNFSNVVLMPLYAVQSPNYCQHCSIKGSINNMSFYPQR